MAEYIPLFLCTNDFFTSLGGELHAEKRVLCWGKYPFHTVWILQAGKGVNRQRRWVVLPGQPPGAAVPRAAAPPRSSFYGRFSLQPS